MTTAHLLHHLLPPHSAKLGRLTTNAHLPHQHYIDPLIPRPTDTEILTAHHRDFSETRTFTRRSHLRLTIALPLSLTFASTRSNTATLTAPQTTTRDLPNSDTWFTEACTQPATRRWLEAAARSGRSVYLVVGVRSAHNAHLHSSSTRSGDIGAQAVVPTVAFVAPGVGGGGGGDGGAAIKMVAEGEQVFAVLYRKVRLTQVFGRSADTMALEGGCRWRDVWDWEESRGITRTGRKTWAPERMVPVHKRVKLSEDTLPVVVKPPPPEPLRPSLERGLRRTIEETPRADEQVRIPPPSISPPVPSPRVIPVDPSPSPPPPPVEVIQSVSERRRIRLPPRETEQDAAPAPSQPAVAPSETTEGRVHRQARRRGRPTKAKPMPVWEAALEDDEWDLEEDEDETEGEEDEEDEWEDEDW